MRLIHAFVKAKNNAKIFYVIFDVKDEFWYMDYQRGEEWDFAYIQPQRVGKPVQLGHLSK